MKKDSKREPFKKKFKIFKNNTKVLTQTNKKTYQKIKSPC